MESRPLKSNVLNWYKTDISICKKKKSDLQLFWLIRDKNHLSIKRMKNL